MIVIASRPGQLGNLLVVYASVAAYCQGRKIRLLNPAFAPYRRYFERSTVVSRAMDAVLYRKANFLARLIDRLRLSNSVIRVVRIGWDDRIDLDKSPPAAITAPVCLFHGWQFRANESLRAEGDNIRRRFTPSAGYLGRLDRFFTTHCGDPSETLVGIHVRRGDYNKFEGGRYYYSWDNYIEVMRSIAALFQDKSIHFIVCSNEDAPTGIQAVAGIRITRGPGQELLDLYALARCHYIAGPPSTFTMWASWYGKAPLYMIRDTGRKVTIDDFKVQEEF